MERVYGRLRERFPHWVGFPYQFKTDLLAFLDERKLKDLQRFNNMLNRGGTTDGPGDMPSFTWDAVATRPPYLRTSDPHVQHFVVRMEKDIRGGPYLVTSSQLKMA